MVFWELPEGPLNLTSPASSEDDKKAFGQEPVIGASSRGILVLICRADTLFSVRLKTSSYLQLRLVSSLRIVHLDCIPAPPLLPQPLTNPCCRIDRSLLT